MIFGCAVLDCLVVRTRYKTVALPNPFSCTASTSVRAIRSGSEHGSSRGGSTNGDAHANAQLWLAAISKDAIARTINAAIRCIDAKSGAAVSQKNVSVTKASTAAWADPTIVLSAPLNAAADRSLGIENDTIAEEVDRKTGKAVAKHAIL